MQEEDEVVESDEAADEEGSGVGGMQHYVFDGNKKGKWLIDSTNKGNVRVRRPQTARQPDSQKHARAHTIPTAKGSVRHSIPDRCSTRPRPQHARTRARAQTQTLNVAIPIVSSTVISRCVSMRVHMCQRVRSYMSVRVRSIDMFNLT